MKSNHWAIALILVMSSASAGGGGPVGGFATEVTQILNNIQLIGVYGEETTQRIQQAQQLANEAQMILNQIQIYQNMINNTSNLLNRDWGNIQADLAALAGVVQQGNALAYSLGDLDAQWTTRFPTLATYLASTYGETSFRADLQTWYQTQVDGLRGALNSANLQAQQFATEETTLQTLKTMSQTANGRQRALQVGHQIAMQQVEQTRKLRELTMAQLQAYTNYQAAEAQRNAAAQGRTQQFFSAPSTVVVGDEATYDATNW